VNLGGKKEGDAEALCEEEMVRVGTTKRRVTPGKDSPMAVARLSRNFSEAPVRDTEDKIMGESPYTV